MPAVIDRMTALLRRILPPKAGNNVFKDPDQGETLDEQGQPKHRDNAKSLLKVREGYFCLFFPLEPLSSDQPVKAFCQQFLTKIKSRSIAKRVLWRENYIQIKYVQHIS